METEQNVAKIDNVYSSKMKSVKLKLNQICKNRWCISIYGTIRAQPDERGGENKDRAPRGIVMRYEQLINVSSITETIHRRRCRGDEWHQGSVTRDDRSPRLRRYASKRGIKLRSRFPLAAGLTHTFYRKATLCIF